MPNPLSQNRNAINNGLPLAPVTPEMQVQLDIQNQTRDRINAAYDFVPFIGDAMAAGRAQDAARVKLTPNLMGGATARPQDPYTFAFESATMLPVMGDLAIAAKAGGAALTPLLTMMARKNKYLDDLPRIMQKELGIIGSTGDIAKQADSLPMDEASRMARAKEMGFDTDTKLYHGSDSKFNEFKSGIPSKRYTTFSERDIDSQGASFSKNPDDAASYGSNVGEYVTRRERTFVPLDQIPASSKDSGAYTKAAGDLEYILEPVIYEQTWYGKPVKTIDIDGGISAMEVDDAGDWLNEVTRGGFEWDHLDNPEVVKRLKERGYDSVLVAEPNDISGESIFMLDLSKIRSTKAKFDPAKKNSANLLAGGAAAAIGANALIEDSSR